MSNVEIITKATQIIGKVDGQRIISVYSIQYPDKQEREWKVGRSSCLPIDMKKAQEYMDCMNLVFKEAEKHGYKKEAQ